MDINQIITYFLSTSVITGGLIYLARIVIDKFVEAKIEKYKNSLQRDTELFRNNLDFKTEKFRHELNIAATEHQIKYSKLYEERGQVIKLIYNLLLELENSLSKLTSIAQDPTLLVNDLEKDNKADESIQKLETYFEQNRIFFSNELCNRIENILSNSLDITQRMFTTKLIHQTDDGVLSDVEWYVLSGRVYGDIRAARLNLAEEFRVLIGVTEKTSAN